MACLTFPGVAGSYRERTRCACRPLSSSQKTELEELRGLFYASACLTFPVFLFGMVFPMVPAMRPFLLAQVLGFPVDEIVKWLLVTPVQFYIGWRFHKGAWQALWNRRCAPAARMLSPGKCCAHHAQHLPSEAQGCHDCFCQEGWPLLPVHSKATVSSVTVGLGDVEACLPDAEPGHEEHLLTGLEH